MDVHVFGVVVTLLLVYWSIPDGLTLDNGLALTPPMGWLSWERFECNTNCEEDPDNCIGERLLMTIADAMVTGGFREAGYRYIVIDDCWPADNRDERGKLQPNLKRFPHGMKALADYIHSRGLKFGLYEDVGRHTCAGAPGSEGHLQIDAQTFADWGIDMLKFDGCNAEQGYFAVGYPEMGHYLNQTGRPILYSCEWPLYDRAFQKKPNYKQVADVCNTWRVYGDIDDAWQSITSILGWYGDNHGNFTQVSGPGRWNDADMIVVGDYGLSVDQERVQLAMWSIFASPLLLSVDVRNIRPESHKLLVNKRVLAVSQDPLGIQGHRVTQMHEGKLQIWVRPVIPRGSMAIAVLNIHDSGYPLKVSFQLADVGLTEKRGYSLIEIFDGISLGKFKSSQNITCLVNPTGIYFVKASPL